MANAVLPLDLRHTLHMADSIRDLRATSDALLRDLEALARLEEEKRTLAPSDPRLNELAEQIHAIAERVLAGTKRQRDLSREGPGLVGADVPIEAVRRSPAEILAEWRDLERRRADAEPGSAARAELDVLSARLRGEYLEAFEQAAQQGDDRPRWKS